MSISIFMVRVIIEATQTEVIELFEEEEIIDKFGIVIPDFEVELSVIDS